MRLAFQDGEDLRDIIYIINEDLANIGGTSLKQFLGLRLGVQFAQSATQGVVDEVFQTYVATSPHSLELNRHVIVDG